MAIVTLVLATALAFHVFKRGMGESADRAAKRIVSDAEKLTGYVTPRRRWLKPTIATALCWAGMMATLTPVSPVLAVWVGGAVIVTGAFAVAKAMPHPLKIDPVDFDRELRELLEQP